MSARTTRVYISGPMTGLPDLNFPAFFQAESLLGSLGFIPLNPATLHDNSDASWEDCMRVDIKALCDCDAIALLPGWERSQGAQLEVHIAHRIGLAFAYLDRPDTLGALRGQKELNERPSSQPETCRATPARQHETATIHEELEAIARAMSSRAAALRQIAEELAAMAETPLKPLCAEVLARELIKLDLCLCHKDAVRRVVDVFDNLNAGTGGYFEDALPEDLAAIEHLKQSLIGH